MDDFAFTFLLSYSFENQLKSIETDFLNMTRSNICKMNDFSMIYYNSILIIIKIKSN